MDVHLLTIVFFVHKLCVFLLPYSTNINRGQFHTISDAIRMDVCCVILFKSVEILQAKLTDEHNDKRC